METMQCKHDNVSRNLVVETYLDDGHGKRIGEQRFKLCLKCATEATKGLNVSDLELVHW